ncbi:MAG TPA: glycosyltransferase family 2 protein, partial [Acidimicrobiales bacterium]
MRQREIERLAGTVQPTITYPPGTDTVTPPATSGIAWLVVVDHADPGALRRTVRSVAEQAAVQWMLTLAVVGNGEPEVEAGLARVLEDLPVWRSAVVELPSETRAADAAAAALAASQAPVIGLLDPGDELAPDATATLIDALDDADVAYADEDHLGTGDGPTEPTLKPDWSPELLLSGPYLGRPFVLRRAVVDAAGGIGRLAGGDWEHDLMLRVAETTERVAHVAEILYHRSPEPPVPPLPAGPGAVTGALARRADDGSVEPGPLPGTWHVRRRARTRPTVSAIIPFRDGARFLRTCVDSVTATAGDVDLEFVLVDNGSVEPETRTLVERLADRSDVVVVRDDRPFNWAALNNHAVDSARGDVLLFLNNDIEARHDGWLEVLTAQALRPEIGAAGARLLYPTGRIQHAGLVIGLGGAAGHVLVGLDGDAPGYLGMAVLTRDCSAVTGACLATRRAVFDDLDGFDVSLGLDLNDIDFCLRARQRGLRVVYEPLVELVHYESPSRGTSGSVDDIARFVDRWEGLIAGGDPFLNPHLTRLNSTCA